MHPKLTLGHLPRLRDHIPPSQILAPDIEAGLSALTRLQDELAEAAQLAWRRVGRAGWHGDVQLRHLGARDGPAVGDGAGHVRDHVVEVGCRDGGVGDGGVGGRGGGYGVGLCSLRLWGSWSYGWWLWGRGLWGAAGVRFGWWGGRGR